MMFSCVFVTFPCGIMGQVWYLIVSIPDLCRLSYFNTTSIYLDAFFKQNNFYFDNIVNQKYVPDLHLDEAYTSDTVASILDSHFSFLNDNYCFYQNLR